MGYTSKFAITVFIICPGLFAFSIKSKAVIPRIGYPIRADCSGKVYYVAPYGSDENPGTLEKPWHSIQKASSVLVAGDIVYIREGTYEERLMPENSGENGCFITYSAYPGEKVIIDGSDITLPEDLTGLVEISEKNYIKIVGLNINNAGPHDNNAGILVKNSSYIILKDNYIENTVSSGIGVWNSHDIVIESNEVTLCCNDGEQECITVAGTKNFEIRNNNVHHNGPGTKGGEGIDVKDGSEKGKVYGNHVHHLTNRVGIYIDAWNKTTRDIEVFQNLVHDIQNNDGIAVGSEEGGLLENVKIYNNIIYNNGFSGIVISDAGNAPKHPVRNVEIINNTLYGNGTKNKWGGGISVENPDVEDLIIRNNICSQNVIFQIQIEVSVANLFVDHNLIDGYRGYDDETKGDDVVEGNPKFVNVETKNFHIKSDSPAVDTGSPDNAPLTDFEGNHRPYGKAYDIGAYEYTTQVFADVPPDYWAFDYINKIYHENITSGCGINPLIYCPDSPITREQIAVFLLKAMKIAPADRCSGRIFSDVNTKTVSESFCRYIEKFAQLGITSGCWPDDPSTPENEAKYCPKDEISRAQMAVFITKALGHKPTITCTGNVFRDVNINLGEGFCRYIEKFKELNITEGCKLDPPLYCPLDFVTRAQMAVFLVKAFLQ